MAPENLPPGIDWFPTATPSLPDNSSLYCAEILDRQFVSDFASTYWRTYSSGIALFASSQAPCWEAEEESGFLYALSPPSLIDSWKVARDIGFPRSEWGHDVEKLDDAFSEILPDTQTGWRLTYVMPWCVNLNCLSEAACTRDLLEEIFELNVRFFPDNDFIDSKAATINHWKSHQCCEIGIV